MTVVPKFELNVVRHIYDNENGGCIKVGPDSDGLGLVEIDGGEDYGRIVVQPQHAILLAKAIEDCAKEMAA